jgi:D-alanyl-D-alanine carboxypeptidase/D-alanyl-D-alanine-endopeptidase (penicillin-binding protein 4)
MRSSKGAALAGGLLAALMASSCAARTADPLTPAPVVTARQAGIRELQRDLAAILASPVLRHGTAGAAVQSVDRNEPLFRYNADRLLLPASALKLITAAVAAERLGWDYRYTTTIRRAGRIEDGVLHGDLVVAGTGDPTFSSRYEDVDGVFARWAAQLIAAGIRRVEGRVIGDDRAFGDEPWGAGWPWDDLPHGFAAPVGALLLNDGRQHLLVVPGLEPGEPASASVLGSAVLSLANSVVTAEGDLPASISFRRMPGDPELHVDGVIPVDSRPLVLFPSVPNPTDHFVQALRGALLRAGVSIGGAAVDIGDLPEVPLTMGAPLVEHRSPPLSAIAAVTLKSSQNLHAESLLRALAFTETPIATAADGLRIVAGTLATWGIAPGNVIAADGSGLSRYSHVTADALLTVLHRMASDDRHRPQWIAALPIGGTEGTLASRFLAGSGRGRVWAKTGSLSDVRALAGYVETRDGEMLAFAILLNCAGAAPADLEAIIDAAVERLAGFSR